MSKLDVDQLPPKLAEQIDVRWALFQYYAHSGQAEKVKQVITQNPPLGRPGVYLALFGAAESYRQGECSDAMELYQIGANLGQESQTRFAEALIRMDYDDPSEILASFKNGLHRRETSLYLLFDWAVLRLLRDDKTAGELAARLVKLSKERNLNPRNARLFQFMAGQCGRAEIEQLLGVSRRSDSGAYFVLGVDALARDKRDEASDYFRKSEQNGYFAFYDYFWSRGFLNRLESGKPWLEWLRVENEN